MLSVDILASQNIVQIFELIRDASLDVIKR